MRSIRFLAACAGCLLTVAALHAAPPKPASKEEPAAKGPTREDVRRSLEQEQKVYLERLELCTRLRQIASETNDDELRRKAELLEKQAEEIYLKRTHKLPALIQEVKAAESLLEEKRNFPGASAAATGRGAGRAPNGRPIKPQE